MALHGSGILIATAVSVVLISDSFHAQTYGTCVPVSERAEREFGCFTTAREELGALPAQPPLSWHLDTFPTAADARAAKGPRGTPFSREPVSIAGASYPAGSARQREGGGGSRQAPG